ncbi:MAG: YkgJ family cysteine cluster protein [Tepidisphaeraceae bacterium]
MPRRSLPVVPWYSEGLSFTCTQCGNCCTGGPGYVWMSDDEVRILADHLKLSVEETVKKHCRLINGRLSLKERKTPKGLYDCVFLIDLPTTDGSVKRGCGIYPVRPLQCRTWPFWDGNLETRESWQRAKRTCPGLDKGKPFTVEQIIALRDAEVWPGTEQTPTSAKTKA